MVIFATYAYAEWTYVIKRFKQLTSMLDRLTERKSTLVVGQEKERVQKLWKDQNVIETALVLGGGFSGLFFMISYVFVKIQIYIVLVIDNYKMITKHNYKSIFHCCHRYDCFVVKLIIFHRISRMDISANDYAIGVSCEQERLLIRYCQSTYVCLMFYFVFFIEINPELNFFLLSCCDQHIISGYDAEDF